MLRDRVAPVRGRVVDHQHLGARVARVGDQGLEAAPERVGAVVVDDYDRDQRNQPAPLFSAASSSTIRLRRPLKIEMKSTAEITCRPRTRKLVVRTRARVSVKTLLPAHWTVSWVSLAIDPSISRRPTRPTLSRKRTEITQRSHRGGSLPASTP